MRHETRVVGALNTVLAKMCHYAQEHVGDPEAWDHSKGALETLMQCTSYQVACFIAQNTVGGRAGVEWDIVLKELCEMPVKSEKKWEKIINKMIKLYGGLA
jgi:hypothetical protein